MHVLGLYPQIIGNLGRDPEMRYTQGVQAVTNFTVAVNRTRRDQAGTTTEETEWFRVVAFDKLGEIADQYLRKGGQVYVVMWTTPCTPIVACAARDAKFHRARLDVGAPSTPALPVSRVYLSDSVPRPPSWDG